MPELPEVEITARRLDARRSRAPRSSRRWPPAMDDAEDLRAAAWMRWPARGSTASGGSARCSRSSSPQRTARPAHPADPPDVGRAAAASSTSGPRCKDRARGSWSGSRTGASCGCASSAPSSRPGRSCCRRDAVAEDEMVATLGPDAWPAPPLEELRRGGRPAAAPPSRCSATSATSPASAAPGSTRSSGRRGSRPSSKGSS